MVVSDIDLRLLKVFRSVVESGGFYNAQTALNVSQSTISTQMSQLETRLGVRLCHRGRSGFSLTPEGEACYLSTMALFKALSTFQHEADELRGSLAGRLRVAFLDNIVTDPDSPIREAFRQFVRQPGNMVQLAVEVLPPDEMERRLLDRRLDVGIGIFSSRFPMLDYQSIYLEKDVLVCSHQHVLAKNRHPDTLRHALPMARKVVRNFLGTVEFCALAEDVGPADVAVNNVEAAAHLILTGEFIGVLPHHYARIWLDRGDMVELLPGDFVHHSCFSYVTHKDRANITALHAFVASLKAACATRETAA